MNATVFRFNGKVQEIQDERKQRVGITDSAAWWTNL